MKILDWILENYALISVAIPVLAGAIGTAVINYQNSVARKEVVKVLTDEIENTKGNIKRNISIRMSEKSGRIQKQLAKILEGKK